MALDGLKALFNAQQALFVVCLACVVVLGQKLLDRPGYQRACVAVEFFCALPEPLSELLFDPDVELDRGGPSMALGGLSFGHGQAVSWRGDCVATAWRLVAFSRLLAPL